MLDWLHRFLHGIESLIPDPIKDAIQWSVSAIASVFGTISGNVSDAWHDFTGDFDALREGIRLATTSIYCGFTRLFTYWIPKVAYPAFWFVTHPDQLASVLFWYIIKWLETYAWQAARYLGTFTLALLIHHVKPITRVMEDIIDAIL